MVTVWYAGHGVITCMATGGADVAGFTQLTPESVESCIHWYNAPINGIPHSPTPRLDGEIVGI